MLTTMDLGRVRRLLCLGAHSDDIEIGAAGTIGRIIERNPGVEIRWEVFAGGATERAAEARQSAELVCKGAGSLAVNIHAFRDGYMMLHGETVKDTFNALAGAFSPDLILTHHDDDRHQDHRFISQLTWNTWRNHAILEYEIFKYDGDLGRPNVFVPLSKAACQAKIDNLISAFPTQATRAWFTPDVFWAMLRLRGAECNSPSQFAEAFHARKVVAG